MTIVLVTRVENDCVGKPERIEFASFAAANDYADSIEALKKGGRNGLVGCIKVANKIKRVF